MPPAPINISSRHAAYRLLPRVYHPSPAFSFTYPQRSIMNHALPSSMQPSSHLPMNKPCGPRPVHSLFTFIFCSCCGHTSSFPNFAPDLSRERSPPKAVPALACKKCNHGAGDPDGFLSPQNHGQCWAPDSSPTATDNGGQEPGEPEPGAGSGEIYKTGPCRYVCVGTGVVRLCWSCGWQTQSMDSGDTNPCPGCRLPWDSASWMGWLRVGYELKGMTGENEAGGERADWR